MSTKAQLKRQKIKEETELLNAKRRSLKAAVTTVDLMGLVPIFRDFKGLKLKLESFNEIPHEYESWALGLIEGTMKQAYESAWGWDAAGKHQELVDLNSRYIFAFDGKDPVGFLNFRFELENREVYALIVDIQVEAKYQRQGLGKFMTQCVEFIAMKLGMDSVLVQLLKGNEAGRKFFRKMNYIVHPSSPAIADPDNEMEYDHELLYKKLGRK